MSILIGLTGGIGSGKSTALHFFKKYGAYTLESDRMAHKILQKKIVTNKIKKIFGKIVLSNNKIDRKKLGRTVFSKSNNLKKLEQIIHPLVFKEIDSLIKKNKKQKYIVIEMPLLFESGYYKKLDININVTCSIKKRIERLNKKIFSVSDFRKRINHQLGDSKRKKIADITIDNSGMLNKTRDQVRIFMKFLSCFTE